MKKIKKALGIGIIAAVFISLFILMVHDSSLEIAVLTWGLSLCISALIVAGVFLATSD